MPRHGLTDARWARVQPPLPANGRRGGQWGDHRPLVNGTVWRLRTGARWRDMPPEFGPRQTAYDRFNRGSADGTLLGVAEVLLADLDAAGGVDWDLWCVRDRRPRQPRRGRCTGRLGRGKRGEFDGHGTPLGVRLTAGQRPESTRLEPLVQSVPDDGPDVPPQKLAGDKGYSAARIRAWLADPWIDPAIARKGPERWPGDEGDVDRAAYKRRNVVERLAGWLKECRALATRFDKLAVNYMGTVRPAIILPYLRLLDSADRA